MATFQHLFLRGHLLQLPVGLETLCLRIYALTLEGEEYTRSEVMTALGAVMWNMHFAVLEERVALQSVELQLGWQVDGETEEWDDGMKRFVMQFANTKMKCMSCSPTLLMTLADCK